MSNVNVGFTDYPNVFNKLEIVIDANQKLILDTVTKQDAITLSIVNDIYGTEEIQSTTLSHKNSADLLHALTRMVRIINGQR